MSNFIHRRSLILFHIIQTLNKSCQTTMLKTSEFQKAIESVENLPLDDQQILLDIIQKRLQEKRRKQLTEEIKEIRQEFANGDVQFGSVNQFLEALDQE
ncbi:hypothetical protein [Synechocystis sp. CS-94]|nr:hypothetical protein [Synechocystis sp. CS-94]